MRKAAYIVISLAVFAVLNYAIFQKEQLKAHGETVYLELAPVDPRSLMQGDYMRLAYALERTARGEAGNQQAAAGYLVIVPDDRNVASFVRFHAGEPLQGKEKLLHYNNAGNGLHIVPDSFMFQEGHAASYQAARYGEFKFGGAGNSMLVGLADAQLQTIRPENSP